jgi:hypothetical protein
MYEEKSNDKTTLKKRFTFVLHLPTSAQKSQQAQQALDAWLSSCTYVLQVQHVAPLEQEAVKINIQAGR